MNDRSTQAAAERREEEEARRALAAIPGFGMARAAGARFARLVGFTNRVYRVDLGGESLCLRIPGGGAAALVDRRAEERNARLAAEAGVAPEVIHFGADGVMLTRFIEDAVPLSPSRLRESAGGVQRGAAALRRLHESGVAFAGAFDPFGFIDSYLGILARLGAPLAASQQRTVEAVLSIREALAARPVPLKPCHCDPTGRNVLDTGEKVWLVDWEFSAMNDPMWDLAYFSIESRFDDEADQALMRAYFGGTPPVVAEARMAVLKPVAEVVAALWALIQAGEGNTSGDFRGYAERAFLSAAKRMAAMDFRQRLALIRRN